MPKAPKKSKQDPPWKILWPEDRGAIKGDQERETLLAAVGFALSNWEELEEALARIFTEFVGARWGGEPAVRAYGSVNSFHGRTDLLNAAAESFFYYAKYRRKIAGPDALITKTTKECSDLIKCCREFSARRNEIAHGKYQFNRDLGYFLKPARYNSRKYDFDQPFGAYSYTSVEIKAYTVHFERLTDQAVKMRTAVARIAKEIS